ncbi:MAG TPA: hypothetical protein VGO04_21885 [Ensifer sp.]|jgi:hypothetical protein|uniref:hypothetical protein n=1 Tax=Ensifer sp. TaxID=1872086 RepID=UPI002E0E5C2A|nr:hypothetical protein [Ensifer sp.]
MGRTSRARKRDSRGLIVAMPRTFFAALFWATVFLLATILPYKITVTAAGVAITETVALAKNENGGGGGNGGGNGGGSSNGGGNSGGNGGGGNSGGKGNSSSNSNSSGSNSKASRSTKEPDDDSGVGVRHKGGISEVITKGRYIMKDARGRTIVNRRATAADKQRLQALAH